MSQLYFTRALPTSVYHGTTEIPERSFHLIKKEAKIYTGSNPRQNIVTLFIQLTSFKCVIWVECRHSGNTKSPRSSTDTNVQLVCKCHTALFVESLTFLLWNILSSFQIQKPEMEGGPCTHHGNFANTRSLKRKRQDDALLLPTGKLVFLFQ